MSRLKLCLVLWFGFVMACQPTESNEFFENSSNLMILSPLPDKNQLVHGADFSKFVYEDGNGVNFQCLVNQGIRYFILGYNLKLFDEPSQSQSGRQAALNLVNVIRDNPDKKITFDIYVNSCLNDIDRFQGELNSFLKAYLQKDTRDFIKRIWLDVEYRERTTFGCAGSSPHSGATLAKWIERAASQIAKKTGKTVGIYSSDNFFNGRYQIPFTDYIKNYMPLWEAAWGKTSRSENGRQLIEKFYNPFHSNFAYWPRSAWQHATENHWGGIPACRVNSIDYNLIDLNRLSYYDRKVANLYKMVDHQ